MYYIYPRQGQYIFCVNHNKTNMQNLELLRATENCLTCQVWQACRRLPTPDLDCSLKDAKCGPLMTMQRSAPSPARVC